MTDIVQVGCPRKDFWKEEDRVLGLEQDLKKLFNESIFSGISDAAVWVEFSDAQGNQRSAVGIPYFVGIVETNDRYDQFDRVIEIAPYLRHPDHSPILYDDRSRQRIPLKYICRYQKLELSDTVLTRLRIERILKR